MNSDAEKNIKGFVEKYGTEGFMRVFLSNYLFELILYQLRSEDTTQSYNSALKFHMKGKDIASLKDTEAYQDEIKKICAKKAGYIIERLKKEGIVESWEKIQFNDPRISEIIQDSLKEIFKT